MNGFTIRFGVVGLSAVLLLNACTTLTVGDALAQEKHDFIARTTKAADAHPVAYFNAAYRAAQPTGGDKTCESLTDETDKAWVACATAAYDYATTQCATAATAMKSTGTRYSAWYLGTLAITALSVGLGASSIANAKAWATFGGATGLGAASSALNSNESSNYAGANTIATLISGMSKQFDQYTGTNKAKQQYDYAVATAAQCEATAASGNTSNAVSKGGGTPTAQN
jgi:hypothetical protein